MSRPRRTYTELETDLARGAARPKTGRGQHTGHRRRRRSCRQKCVGQGAETRMAGRRWRRHTGTRRRHSAQPRGQVGRGRGAAQSQASCGEPVPSGQHQQQRRQPPSIPRSSRGGDRRRMQVSAGWSRRGRLCEGATMLGGRGRRPGKPWRRTRDAGGGERCRCQICTSPTQRQA